MTFLVHHPGAPLDSAVEAFYCPAGPMPYRCEHVMPGTVMDLKINFGEAVAARGGGAGDWDAQSNGGWCMGLWDVYHSVRWPSHVDFIGVTLRPGGAFALFGFEAHELGNQIVALDALLGTFATELRERLAEARDAKARFTLLEAMLTARLRRLSDVDRVAPALKLLERSNGMVPIADLVAATNVSHKHLVTLFNRVVGAPPKTLARLYRLEHLVAAIDAGDERTWTGVAHDFDYFDQAHFNKDFKRFTGHTPARYRALRRSAQVAYPDHASHRRLFPQG
jgi:methylphosphotriester-DNA--protein-cysteine methyltransferase